MSEGKRSRLSLTQRTGSEAVGSPGSRCMRSGAPLASHTAAFAVEVPRSGPEAGRAREIHREEPI